MEITPLLKDLSASPFVQLDALLHQVEVCATAPAINLTIGEPQQGFPEKFQSCLIEEVGLWQKYPPSKGNVPYRQAVQSWLETRFNLPDNLLSPEKHITACAGTREALFFLGLLVQNRKLGQGSLKPVVLLPNPYYHAYASAAVFSGAEPVLVPATAETGFMPDFSSISEDILERTVLAFFCHPANPQGQLASSAQLSDIHSLAQQYDFLAAFDECYSEIYLQDDRKPTSALCLPDAQQTNFSNMVVLNSLSKRSSAAGIRCGFVAGDPDVITGLSVLISRGGAPVPLPILKMATSLWSDETHVAANRSFYRQNFKIAQKALNSEFLGKMPEAGFFLWMTVPGQQTDIETMVQELWKHQHIKVIPGHFMAENQIWQGHETNPGLGYLRLALVHDAHQTQQALTRLNAFLTQYYV